VLFEHKHTLLKPGDKHIGLCPEEAEDDDPKPPVVESAERDDQFIAEENALAALADVVADHQDDDVVSAPSNFLVVDGKQIHKGSLVHSIFKRGVTSTDRLKRVRGYARFSVETNDDVDVEDSRKQVLDIGDLFLSNVTMPKGTTVALLMVEGIPVRPLPVSRLVTAGTIVEAKILRLVDNPDPDQDGTLIWDRTKDMVSIKVPGVNVNACTLDIASFNSEVSYRVSVDTFTSLAELVTGSGAAPIKIADCQFLPYAHASFTAADPAVDGKKVTCGRCKVQVSATDMRVHMGRHILGGLEHKEAWAFTACGFCGGGCTVSAEKGSKKDIIKCVSACPLAHNFSVKSALKEPKKGKAATKAFCTNVPVKCTVCVVPTSVWKYSLPQHFALQHSGLQAPDEMLPYMTVSPLEKNKLLNISLPYIFPSLLFRLVHLFYVRVTSISKSKVVHSDGNFH
jgi:hypothetical protein